MLAYQCVATAIFGAAVMLGQLETWHIFAYILAMGFAFVILDPTRMTIIASSVPSGRIVNAFALNSLGFSVMRLAAPAVGGGVLALWGAWPALMLEAALHLMAVGFALGLRLPRMEQTPLRFKSGFSRIAEGARYVKGEPVILGIALMGVLMPLLGFTFVNGLMPVYAAEVFFVDSVGLGLLMASIGAGSTLGTLVLASFSTIGSRGRLMALSVFLTGVTMMLFSQMPTMHTAFPLLMLVSASTMLFLLHGQRDDPEHRAGAVQGQGGVAIRANVRCAAGGQPDGGGVGAAAWGADGDAAGGGVHACGAAGAVAGVPVAVAAAVGGAPGPVQSGSFDRMPSSNSLSVTGEPPVKPSVALSRVVTWTLSLMSLKRLSDSSSKSTVNQAMSPLDRSPTSSMCPRDAKKCLSTTTAIFLPHLRSVGTLICN